jgi:RNA polymerase sigma-70 factor, ECF subfamily
MNIVKPEKKLIVDCLRNNRKAQRQLYEKFAPVMINICVRYCENKQMAEEVMQEGFLSVFKNLDQLNDINKLYAWIKKIMVNTSLMRIRKKDKLVFLDDEILSDIQHIDVFEDESYEFLKEDIVRVMNEMPKGYKLIFNMYAVDDYSHKQIARMLNISESTSKSQLSRARNHLKSKLNRLKTNYYSKTGSMAIIVSMSWICNQLFN